MTPERYDHLRPTTDAYPDDIYRVVGTTESSVTLLRVGDEDGRRVHTGELVSVSHAALDGFKRAPNPDGNRSLAAFVASVATTAYWSLRVFVRELAAHPLASAVVVAFVLFGTFGDRLVSLPDTASGVLVVLGSLGLAYVGSGRL
ncbi:hypothetical protein VB779_20780 [Haloarculaceae archaeon H-GB11]|nr:hypothetical protein [Haloarculaceae archaeon H-GB11]